MGDLGTSGDWCVETNHCMPQGYRLVLFLGYISCISLFPGRRSHDVREAEFQMADRAHERVSYCKLNSPGNKIL